MSARAHERWEGFLNQIAGRHREVCAEAEAGAKAALETCGFDTLPISHAWQAINHRLLELSSRILETWNDKVEATYESEGYDRATQLADRRRGEDLTFQLENDRHAVEMRVFAFAGRELFRRAMEAQGQHGCPSCGAPLALPVVFHAINVTCTHCHAVATYEPGMEARTAAGFGAHAISSESAQEEWLAMRRAERAIHDTRSPTPLHLLKAYESTQIAYWTRYYTTNAHLEPHRGDVAREVKAKMDFWYQYNAASEPTWRNAGGPREIK